MKSKAKGIFIAGTDTGVGKSVVTGLLSRYLLNKGYRVVTQKWVQTGAGCDIGAHLMYMGKKKEDFKEYLSLIMPYYFEFASSPHLAAKLENRRIYITKIKNSLKMLSKNFDFVVIEGSGGLIVPFNSKHLQADIVKELKLSVLIVAGNRLGAINHTLLSVEALTARKMRVLGIVFDNILRDEKPVILKDNPETIRKLSGKPVLGVLPWVKDLSKLHKRFVPIGDKVIANLWIDG